MLLNVAYHEGLGLKYIGLAGFCTLKIVMQPSKYSITMRQAVKPNTLKNPKPKTQNPKPKTQNPKPKTQNPKPKNLNPKP